MTYDDYQMEDWNKYDQKLRYMILDRLRQDCEYYLGYGNRSKNHLWAENEERQIANMRAIWISFPDGDKPEWLTMEQIDDYAKQMGVTRK